MDTFDVRKYITEQNIKEQEGYERRYAISFKDGSTEEVGRHISVSPEDVMGSLRKSFERQGKSVSDIKHLGIKPVGIYEADEDELSGIVSWAADTLDFELSPRMQDAIANSLEQGIPSNIIKKQLSSKKPINIREEKDVIEPEEDAKKKDNPETKTVNKTEVISSVEKKLASLIKNAYDDEEPPEISKSEILTPLKNLRYDTDYYSEMFDEIIDEYPDNPVEESLDFIISEISYEYLKKKVDDTGPKTNMALSSDFDELVFIFKDYFDFDYMMSMIGVYIDKKNRNKD